MFKKICVALLFVYLPLRLHAGIHDEGVTREKSVSVRLSTTVPINANPAVFVLVHLSSPSINGTYIFPHGDTGEIDVSHIHVDIDKLAASTGSVKIGVINTINQSSGSAVFFWSRSYVKNVSNTDTTPAPNESPTFYRCKVIPRGGAGILGLTPFITSNDTRSLSTLYNTATQLNSPFSNTAIQPGLGDIVMEVVNSDNTNTVNIGVELFYHSEP